MNRTATVIARLNFSPDVQIKLTKALEVSLDCHVCERLRRTIFFATEPAQVEPGYRNERVSLDINNNPALCTPRLHKYPGRVVHKEVTTSQPPEIIFRFEYQYEPFVDRDGDSSTQIRSWARISFIAVCPNCSQEKTCSVQSNTVRPWTKHCECGHVLFVDETSPEFVDVSPIE